MPQTHTPSSHDTAVPPTGVGINPTRWRNRPLLLFLAVVGLIFLAEMLVMIILQFLPEQEPVVEAFIDAFMLTLFTFPLLYLLVLKPMSHQLHMRRLREQQAAEAQKFDRLKSEFISTAAHELCTPVTVVRGYIELLRDTDCDAEEEKAQYLSVIYEKTEMLERIVDDMLDIGRGELGLPMRLIKEHQALRPVLEDLVAAFRKIHPQALIEADLPAYLPSFSFDRVRLEQVFGNLLGNAIKFSPAGAPVRLSARYRPGRVEVVIEDRGVGMDAATIAKVFEKFYRADNSPTAKGGLGIGLTIVRSIVEAHGGTVRLASRPGQGTTATVTFSV